MSCIFLAFLFVVDPAIATKLSAGTSGERERGAYAVARTYDPESLDDRALVGRALLSSAGAERAAVVRGLCDRAFPGGLPRSALEAVLAAFDDKDPNVVAAATGCLDRLSESSARTLFLEQLDASRGRGSGSTATFALLAAAARRPDPKLRERIVAAADALGVRVTNTPLVIDAPTARVLAALAANGVNVAPALKEDVKRSSKPEPADAARRNAVRGAGGDAKAVDALVETANVGFDLVLRREAMDMIAVLPGEARRRALGALALPRLEDFDGGVRARLMDELTREGATDLPWIEAALLRAARDPFPDLRLQAAAALMDRAAAGLLTDAGGVEVTRLAGEEKDPAVLAVLRGVLRADPR